MGTTLAESGLKDSSVNGVHNVPSREKQINTMKEVILGPLFTDKNDITKMLNRLLDEQNNPEKQEASFIGITAIVVSGKIMDVEIMSSVERIKNKSAAEEVLTAHIANTVGRRIDEQKRLLEFLVAKKFPGQVKKLFEMNPDWRLKDIKEFFENDGWHSWQLVEVMHDMQADLIKRK